MDNLSAHRMNLCTALRVHKFPTPRSGDARRGQPVVHIAPTLDNLPVHRTEPVDSPNGTQVDQRSPTKKDIARGQLAPTTQVWTALRVRRLTTGNALDDHFGFRMRNRGKQPG